MPTAREVNMTLPGSDLTEVVAVDRQNRYRLIRRIAGGAQSAVWRARDTLTGRDVVVKRLDGAAFADPIARRRLNDEATAAGAVRHANTLPLLDRVDSPGEMALVFPYVEGETLAARLAREQRLAPEDAARIGLAIADALASAHTAGVVHRDVKPGNILLAENGEARLIDFGIARVEAAPRAKTVGGSDEALDITAAGMAIGTLRYMSPEQLTGAEPTPADDAFGLGVVLYQMLTGVPPFDGRSPAEQLALLRSPAAPMAAPEPLRGLVTQALDPRPETRVSAAQLARGLRAWIESPDHIEPLTVERPAAVLPAAPKGSYSDRRRPVAVALGLAACLIVVAVFVSGLPGGAPSEVANVSPTATPALTNSPAPATERPSAPAATQPRVIDTSVGQSTQPPANQPSTPTPNPVAQPNPGANNGPPPHAKNDKEKNNRGGKGKKRR